MKIKAVVILCAISLLAVAGCGEKTGQPVVAVDVEKTDLGKGQPPEGEIAPEGKNMDNPGSKEVPGDGNTARDNAEKLEGSVKSIGDAGIVVSRSFTEEKEGVLLMYAPAEGSGEEVLVTVNFSEDTRYMLHTVKNGGVNGDSDVTETEASFADIEEGSSLSLEGYFVTPDKEYMADSVIIYKFI